MKLDINAVVAQITDIVMRVVTFALLLLIAAVVLAKFGVRQGVIPVSSATDLAWLCGAWWLFKGGKI